METDDGTAASLALAWETDPEAAADSLAAGIANSIVGVKKENVDVFGIEIASGDGSTPAARLLRPHLPSSRGLQAANMLNVLYVIHVPQSRANATNMSPESIAYDMSSRNAASQIQAVLVTNAAALGLAGNATVVAMSAPQPASTVVLQQFVPGKDPTTTTTVTTASVIPDAQATDDGVIAAANGNIIALIVAGACFFLCLGAVLRHILCKPKSPAAATGAGAAGPATPSPAASPRSLQSPREQGSQQMPEDTDVTFILWDLDLDAVRPPTPSRQQQLNEDILV